MKRIVYSLFFSLLGIIFYCILMESFNLLNIIIGLLIAIIGNMVLNRDIIINFTIKKIFKHVYHIVRTILSIFTSSIRVIGGLFKKKDYKISKIDSLKDINTVVDANSITLTPGTVVVDRDDESLYILEFSGEGDD